MVSVYHARLLSSMRVNTLTSNFAPQQSREPSFAEAAGGAIRGDGGAYSLVHIAYILLCCENNMSSLLSFILLMKGEQHRSTDEVVSNITTQPRKKSVPFIRGLVNSGNTCYVNALLQALASCHGAAEFCTRLDLLFEQASLTYGSENQHTRRSLGKTLIDAIHALQPRDHDDEIPRNTSPMDLSEIERNIRHLNVTFSNGFEQQDADEFVIVLMEAVDKEARKLKKLLAPRPVLTTRNHSGTIDWWGSTTTDSSSSLLGHRPNSEHVPAICRRPVHVPTTLVNPLLGSIVHEISCITCGRVSPLSSLPFYVLACPLARTATTLEECICQSFKCEFLQDVECDTCKLQGRGSRQPARKRTMLGRVPNVLCVRLERNVFNHDIGRALKDSRHISFPLTLDLKELSFISMLSSPEFVMPNITTVGEGITTSSVATAAATNMLNLMEGEIVTTTTTSTSTNVRHGGPSSKTKYELKSVVEHSGTMVQGGHFVAFRKVGESWFRASDQVVYGVSESEMRRAQVYMCFYERVE